MFYQIIWGSVLLGICAFVHLPRIVWWARFLLARSRRIVRKRTFFSALAVISGTFAVLLFSHTIQVWIWAIFILAAGALPSLEDAVYFSLVTYTTVGYGDVTLADEYRIFGAMASVSGLLNFGVSTAFLVGVIGRVLLNQGNNNRGNHNNS